MLLADIRDQDVPLRFLRRLIASGRVPNGLLFWGPAGVGKGLTATAFAKALLCPGHADAKSPDAVAARKIDHGNHPDLRVVAPLKKSRIIDVEAIDGIIEMASLRPTESKWRVIILRDADRMRGPAQNHLLKTLEEPLGRTSFILITEHPQLLLPTIRSRCQRVRFGRLRPETVQEILVRERGVEPERAAAIAAVAQGQVSRAFDLIDTDKREVVIDLVQRLANGEEPMAVAEEFSAYVASQRAAIDEQMKSVPSQDADADLSKETREEIKDELAALADAQARRDILDLLYLVETWYRDVLVYSESRDASLVFNRDRLDALEELSGEGVAEKLAALEKARLYLERFITEDRVFRDLFFALAG